MLKYKKYFIFGLLVLAVILRLYQITTPELWYDEAYTGLTVQANWGKLAQIIHDDVHPPLYYVALKVVTDVLGSSALVLRGFSAFFGVALVWLTYRFALRHIVRNDVLRALAPAAFVAISPLLIGYSQEARAYTMFAFLFLLALHLVLNNLAHPNKRDLVTLAATLPILMLTHYAAAFGIAGLGLIFGWQLLRKLGLSKSLAVISPLLLAAALWAPIALEQVRRTGDLGWIPKPNLQSLINSAAAVVMGVDHRALGYPPVQQSSIFAVGLIGVMSIILVIAVAAYLIQKRKAKILQIYAAGALPVVAIFICANIRLNMYVDRYLLPYTLVLAIIATVAVAKADIRMTFAGGAGYLLLLLTLIPAPPSQKRYQLTLSKSLAEYQSGEVLLVTNALDFAILKYYIPAERRNQLKLLDLNYQYGYSSWAIIDDEDVVPKAPSNSIYFLI